MKSPLLILLFMVTSVITAQSEFSTKFKAIPAPKLNVKTTKIPAPEAKDKNADEKEIPGIKAPNIFDNTKITSKSALQIGEEKPKFSMSIENDFANPSDRYVEKLQSNLDKSIRDAGLKEGRGILIKRNISLGSFKTKAKYLVVKLRDFGAIDGDLVKVSSNDQVYRDQLFLDANYKDVRIPLTVGFNKLDFEALNIGSLGGNTAEIRVYDDQGTLVSNDYWDNLAAGFKASILVTREE